jgi:hypothetical protein
MRTFLAPIVFALAFALPQDPKTQEPPAPRPPGLPGSEVAAARVRGEILGAWQLTKGEIPDLGTAGSGVVGYAMFIDGYMSLEIHVLANSGRNYQDPNFQSGTHRWKIGDTSLLESFSLIGAHNSSDTVGEFDFEPPGIRREYKVEIDGDRLTLLRTDRKVRLTFMRLGKLRFPDGQDATGPDFYGRPTKPKGDKPAKDKDG